MPLNFWNFEKIPLNLFKIFQSLWKKFNQNLAYAGIKLFYRLWVLFFSILVIFVCSGCSSKDKENKLPQVEEIDLQSVASVQAPGWKEEKSMMIIEPSDMIKIFDREGELCIAYGIKKIALKEFKNQKGLLIRVEVYEFDNSESAYGMYSFDTVGKKMDIGQEAIYEHGLLKFWKDRVLVRIIAEEEIRDLENDILEFGRQVDSKILLPTSLKPKLLALLPENALVPDSVVFFYNNNCFNNIHYIPESTVLFLSGQTKAVTGLYALVKDQPLRLLIIQYPNDYEANTAFNEFGKSYYQENFIPIGDINIAKVDENEYDATILKGTFVILIFQAQNSDICKKMIAEALTKVELYR